MDETSAHQRLYESLKDSLSRARPTREPYISPTPLADVNRVSVTPVREVLFRLAGERLLEVHADSGFALPRLGHSALVDLYSWNGQHLLAALHLLSEETVGSVLASVGLPDAGSPGALLWERVETFFEAIGRATGNREFEFQIAEANARLRRPRLAEARLFPDLGRELRAMVRRDVSGVKSNVRRRIHAYHRRRMEHAGKIARMLVSG